MRSAGMTRRNRSTVMQSTLLLVLGAESVLFGTLVMSYLFMRSGGSSMHFIPPKPFDIMIASLNTLILLASATFARSAQQAIARDHVDGLKTNLMFALALGVLFLAGQIFEFNHAGMRIDDSTFGGVFFALVSFHALHVLAGMIVLAINVARAYVGDFSGHRYVAVTGGTWFWYYVAGIWIILFTVLYIV